MDIKIKITDQLSALGAPALEINGVVASSVIHLTYKGFPLIRVSVEGGAIKLFGPAGARRSLEILSETNHEEECIIQINNADDSWIDTFDIYQRL